MLKTVLIIKDKDEREQIESYFYRAKREIENFKFKLVKIFDDNRQALKFLCQQKEIDIIIVENTAEKTFSTLDLIMLAKEELSRASIILLAGSKEKLKFDFKSINNLTSILKKGENYAVFYNLLLLTILKQKEKKEELKEREEKLNDYRTIIDHTHDAIFLLAVDCDNNFYYKRINGTHQRLTSLNNEEIKGKKTSDIFSKDIAEKLEENYYRCLRKKKRINYTETFTVPAGTKTWQTTLYPVVRKGRVEEIVGASYDITDLEAKQQHFDYIKRHDKLTGLYNKEYFNQIFLKLNQDDQIDLSMLLINIENFHLLNKLFNYQQADQILKEIGLILSQITDNNKIAAHLYADHFAIILKNQSDNKVKMVLDFIQNKINQINIDEVYLDSTLVFMRKINKNISAHAFFNDLVSEMELKSYKETKSSRLYKSLLAKIERDDYRSLRQSRNLINICSIIADYFDLNSAAKEKLKLLARNHDIGKLALNENIVKKGEKLTAAEWYEYQKHVVVSANFSAAYYDLMKIRNLIYYHHENFDGSGWPEGLKGNEIPYLNRLFAVINFYSNLKTNFYFPLNEDQYYFAALEKDEIIVELNNYRGINFDPKIVDKFIEFIKLQE